MGAAGGREEAVPRVAATTAARFALTGIAYVAGYIALDWISFRYEFAPIGITPWNPPPALSIALLLRGGLVYAPWLFPAALAADAAVRGIVSWEYTLVSALIIACGYGLAAATLRRWRPSAFRMESLRDVVAFMATMALATAAVAAAQGLASVATGQLRPETWGEAAVRYWAGDLSGILVLGPLLLRPGALHVRGLRARLARVELEAVLQIGALGLTLWIVFGLESTDEFKFFFLTLVPIIWISVRHGLDGACLAILGGQLGMLVLVAFRGFDAVIVTEFQLLMLLVAATGLVVGTVADGRAAADRSLRAQQAELARFSRISVAGEMVSALAHELSQPLSATSTYLAESRRLLARAAPAADLADSLERAARQAKRASDVVARLRGFLYRGETTLARVPAQSLVGDSLALVQADAALSRTQISSSLEAQPAPVVVDAVQMQQVVINVIRNAVEAMADAATPQRRIDIAQRTVGRMIEISVADSGPGLAPEIADRVFEPFVTTKAGGMGLGLAISRSIVEAHGGQLRFERSAAGGAMVVITLPRAGDEDG